MNPILLDTHAALWAFDGKLEPETARVVVEGAASHGELMISPITAWEIGMLVKKRRLSLALTVEDFVRALFALPGVILAALTPTIAVAAAALPDEVAADPADRFLIATAAAYGARFVHARQEDSRLRKDDDASPLHRLLTVALQRRRPFRLRSCAVLVGRLRRSSTRSCAAASVSTSSQPIGVKSRQSFGRAG